VPERKEEWMREAASTWLGWNILSEKRHSADLRGRLQFFSAFKNLYFFFGFLGGGREITLHGGHIQAHAGDALLHIAECVEAAQLVSSHPVRTVVQRDIYAAPVAEGSVHRDQSSV